MFSGNNASQGAGGFLGGNPATLLGLALMSAGDPSGRSTASMLGPLLQAQEFAQTNALNQKKFQLELQQFGLAKQAAEREAQKFQKAMGAMSDFQNNVIGQAGKPAVVPGQGDTPLMLKPQDAVPGTGLLGNQITPQQARIMAAADLFNAGNTSDAASMLKETYGTPQLLYDSKTNQPVLTRLGEYGGMQQIPGMLPLSLPGGGSSGSSNSVPNAFIDPTANPSGALFPGMASLMSLGSLNNNQQANSAGVNMPLTNAPNNSGLLIKDPKNAPSRGGQGGSYINPVTGQVRSSDTQKQLQTDQAAVAALSRAAEQIDAMQKVLPQFQTSWNQSLAYLQGLSNKSLHTNFALPNQRAEGESLLASIPESLVKGYAVDPTVEALKMSGDIIRPRPGESDTGYYNRLDKIKQHLRDFVSQAQERINNGIPVGNIYNNQTPSSNAAASTAPVMTYDLKSKRWVTTGRQ